MWNKPSNFNKVINGEERAAFDLQLVGVERSENHQHILVFGHIKINQNIDLDGYLHYQLTNNYASRVLHKYMRIGKVLEATALLKSDKEGILWLSKLIPVVVFRAKKPLSLAKRMHFYITKHQAEALKSRLDN